MSPASSPSPSTPAGVDAAHLEPGRGSVLWTFVTWVLVIATLVGGTLVMLPIAALAAMFGDKRRVVGSFLLAGSFNLLTRVHPRYRVTVTGKENLPPAPYILCPNHQSYSDVVYLYSLREHFKWVVKRELFFVPPFGPAMWMARYPSIRRGDVDDARRLMSRVQALVQQGVSVLVFPEGSRSPTGELQAFQRGAARMAVAGQVPLVPVGVIGTGRLLPKGSLMYPAHGHIWIHVGEPIPTAGVGASVKELRRLTEALREGVEAAKAEAAQGVEHAQRADRR